MNFNKLIKEFKLLRIACDILDEASGESFKLEESHQKNYTIAITQFSY